MKNKIKGDTYVPQIAETGRTDYSVHTITFRAMLSYKDKIFIERKLEALSKKYNKGFFVKPFPKTKYKSVCYPVARDFRLNNITVSSKELKKGTYKYWMDIKINPRWMFHENDHPFVYINGT